MFYYDYYCKKWMLLKQKELSFDVVHWVQLEWNTMFLWDSLWIIIFYIMLGLFLITNYFYGKQLTNFSNLSFSILIIIKICIIRFRCVIVIDNFYSYVFLLDSFYTIYQYWFFIIFTSWFLKLTSGSHSFN